jgi:glycosyltransferase involved in cell wall biosynthesis
MVTPGVNGLLAITPEEWQRAVAVLLTPQGRQMGRAGRARVEADYSVAAGARKWATILDGLQEGAARAA